MNTWFTSDHHFGHTNIIEYANRPFDNIDQMDETLIDVWNNVVDSWDTVYHLGDFTLGKKSNKYFYALRGNIKILVNPWHHDRRWIYNTYPPKVELCQPIVILEKPHVTVLCHYPFAEWDRKHYGSWHLHGHSHGNYTGEGKILDVGVDNAYRLFKEFRPFSLQDIIKIMEKKDDRRNSYYS